VNTAYDGNSWKASLPHMRFTPYGNPYRANYNLLFGDNNQRICPSLSEIYCLQTARKDFEQLPEFNSKKLKIAAIEGFSLKASDVLGFKKSDNDQDNDQASIDVQGALLNNPSQISHIFDQILGQTIQKGHYDSLISIDVDKFLIEEYRETLIGVKELNDEVRHEF
jgi:hypothetical protein